MTTALEARHAEPMQTLEGAWNAQDCVHNRPNKTSFAGGDWTCSIAKFTVTMKGPMVLAGGTTIQPTGKSFEVDFCTVARWHEGQMVEENLFYDVVGMMKHLDVG